MKKPCEGCQGVDIEGCKNCSYDFNKIRIMQVFVVMEYIGYEEFKIRRVFDSKIKAEDFIEKRKRKGDFQVFERTLL